MRRTHSFLSHAARMAIQSPCRRRAHRTHPLAQRPHGCCGNSAGRGARVILATATNADAMTKVIGGLDADGQLLVVGATPEAIQVSPLALILGRRSVAGWPSGTSIESEDTLRFS